MNTINNGPLCIILVTFLLGHNLWLTNGQKSVQNVTKIGVVNPVLEHWQLLLSENKCLKIQLDQRTQVQHNLQHWFELPSFLWTMFAYMHDLTIRLVLSKHLCPIVRSYVRKRTYENSNNPWPKFKNKHFWNTWPSSRYCKCSRADPEWVRRPYKVPQH